MPDAHPAGEPPEPRAPDVVGDDPRTTTSTVEALKASVLRHKAQAEAVAERMEGRPIPDIVRGLYERDRAAAGSVVGSALALRLFLFFVPLVLFVVGLLGFASAWTDSGSVNENAGVSGVLARQIDAALDQPNSTRWIAVLVGLFGVLTTGRTLTKVLMTSSCLSWRLPLRAKVPIPVVGALVGLMVGVTFIATVVNRIRADAGLGLASLSLGGAFVLYAIGWMALSLPLPRGTPDPGCLLPGAVLIALTIVGMQAVSQLYLPGQYSQASELYGAIGAATVTLGWFFFLGRGMVLASTLNAVVFERIGSVTTLLFALPGMRRLPAHSAPLRRMLAPAETPVVDGEGGA